MWVLLNDAFVSIVQHNTRPGVLLVRARRKDDLERLFPERVHLIETTLDGDYPFRIALAKDRVLTFMRDAVEAIDYPNFKDSVRNPTRRRLYGDVWAILTRLTTSSIRHAQTAALRRWIRQRGQQG